jgi:hypothetical protein
VCHLACGEQAAEQSLPLRVHTLAGCDLPPALARSTLELVALGDFPASNASAEILRLDQQGAALRFPLATRAVEARVDGGVTAFTGYGERRENGLDVLLWPEASTCVVWQPEGRAYPGRGGGQALGFSPSSGLVLAAGGNDPLVSDAIVGAVSLDVATGALKALDRSTAGVLAQPRAFATVTVFGERLLVSGGEQPVSGVPEADVEPQATAEVFDTTLGRFSGELIELRNNRTHHAALTLDDGRTLLVGGRSKVGVTSIAQYQLEIVDPKSKRASVGDVITARIEPRALRLSDGRIFVAGGVRLDGAPAEPAAEWLTADARLDTTKLSREVAPRFERAFVATEGGGVLAVGGCEDRPPASDQDARACAASCSHGCPPLGGQYEAWWIDRDGAATPVRLEGISAPRPLLLPGSDGSPWLVAAEASAPEKPRLFRFNPWAAGFEPANVPDDLRLPRPGTPEPLAFERDAFVWVDEADAQGQLLGLRLGTRNRYARDLALVGLSDPIDPTRPQHLVPDRPLGAAASYDGALRLIGAAFRAEQAPPNTDPDVTIRVADTDYGDVTVKLQIGEGAPPRVLLGETELGGVACPWPDGTRRGADFELPTVRRSGMRAELLFHGGGQACQVENGRLQLALRAGDGVSTITELDVQRGAHFK